MVFSITFFLKFLFILIFLKKNKSENYRPVYKIGEQGIWDRVPNFGTISVKKQIFFIN